MYPRSEFITDDDGLMGVIGCFEPTVVKHENSSEGSATQYSFTVKFQRLLTDIEADEYEQLLDLLTAETGVVPEV